MLPAKLPVAGKVLSMVYQKKHGFEENGSSKTLGGAHDIQLLKTMRSWSDVIMTSGATAVAEGYPDADELHILTNQQLSFPKATIWGPRADLESVVSELQTRHQKILFETGPSLSRALLSKSLMDLVILNIDTELELFETEMAIKLDIQDAFEIKQWSIVIAQPRTASL